MLDDPPSIHVLNVTLLTTILIHVFDVLVTPHFLSELYIVTNTTQYLSRISLVLWNKRLLLFWLVTELPTYSHSVYTARTPLPPSDHTIKTSMCESCFELYDYSQVIKLTETKIYFVCLFGLNWSFVQKPVYIRFDNEKSQIVT